MTRVGLLALLALATIACGNYSNEDLDFQLAVPDRDDLAVHLPQQHALVGADAAEYLLTTRDTVGVFNQLIDGLTDIVDRVRSLTPSERQPNLRVWGPFPHETAAAFELRMRMTRAPAEGGGYRFAYEIEFHRTGMPAGPWHRIMAGSFSPGGGARRGAGELELVLAPARAAGYPVGDFRELETLRVKYQRVTFPMTVTMTIENLAGSEVPRASYDHALHADGAGSMSFVWRTRDRAIIQALGVQSRWRADGAGRAHARVVEGPAGIVDPLGIDCWGGDGRNTYLVREFPLPRREEGSAPTCVFPAP